MRSSKAALLMVSPALLAFLSCSDLPGPVAPQAEPVAAVSFARGGGANLLVCPTTQTASASGNIGLGGGRIRLGGHELVVPKGALRSPQRFRIEVRRSPHIVVSFLAEGHDSFVFLRPATVTLDYSQCEAAESASALHMYQVDGRTLRILEDMGGVRDPESNTLTTQTSRLSDYAVGSPQ